MDIVKQRNKRLKIKIYISVIALVLSGLLYLLYKNHFQNPSLFQYIMSLRLPTMICMMIAAITIGISTLVFQSIVNNHIVTPALLGMSSIYSFLHTAVVFMIGSSSILFVNENVAFIVDLFMMGTIGTILYWFLFQKTNFNLLYMMLMGTVLSSLFSSMQQAMVKMMDPNEYDTLLSSLMANFNHVNQEIIILAIILSLAVAFFIRNDLKKLDIIALGREQAINLGIEYDQVIRRLLIAVVLWISIATASVGPLTFLGLIIANLSRQMLKTYQHQYLMIFSAILGMIALIVGQMISQHLFHFNVPVSVFVSIAGGIYFLYLLLIKQGG